jgi:membrane protein YdbS with pleckstrin-like domain
VCTIDDPPGRAPKRLLVIGMPATATTRARREGGVGAVALLVVGFCLGIFGSEPVRIVSIAVTGVRLVLTAVESCWLETRRRRAFRLTITGGTVTIARGTLFRRVDTIPLDRVTIVRTSVGPISRRYGHVGVTLVATTQEVTLPPLSEQRSRQLVAAIEARDSG